MAWGATCIAASTAVVDVIPVRQRGLGLGYHGMASSVASVFAAAAGLAVANAAGYNAMFVFASALCFVALLLGGAVKYPVCAQRPKVWRWSQLLEKTSLPVSLNFLIVSLTTGGLTGFVAIYAREKGFVNIGAFFIISAICGIFSRWIGGIIFNRTGPREVSVAALLMLLFCFPTLVLIPSVMGFYLAAALYGMGSGILYLSFQAMVNNLVPPQRRGAANATLFTILNLGYALGKVLTGFAADAVGLDRTFLCFSAVNAIALAFFVMYVYKHYLTAANAAAAMTNASQ